MSKRDKREMLAADARMDQILAAVTEGARDDIPAWADLGRRLNQAADTRAKCDAMLWDTEEVYRIVRLAHAAHGIITGRLLGRKV